MSTESNIPDFRGPQGIWTMDKMAEAKAYERYELFLRDPVSYWKEMSATQGTHGAFYSQLREAAPNAGHYALARLEETGYVRSVITQNIDGLHEKAGSKKVIHYHGSVHKLRCLSCGLRFEQDEIPLDNLPPHCKCGMPLKYDVVHFKESIPIDTMKQADDEVSNCDLMLICGTSAVVYPFAALPRELRMQSKASAKIIEVNAKPTSLTHDGISDYLIQGNTGEVLPSLAEAIMSLHK